MEDTLGRKLHWQIGPPAFDFRDVEQGIDDAAEVSMGLAGRSGLGEERLESAPLLVGGIGVVDGASHSLDTRCRGEMGNSGQGCSQRKCGIY